jgi:hypothetical protein
MWKEETNGTVLIEPPGHLFWTEHSERHTVTSWSASLGIEKSRNDHLGRWGVDKHQSNDYVVTARLAVTSIQREVCTAISEGTEKIDEDDLYADYADHLHKYGVEESQIKLAVDRLTLPRLYGGAFGIGQVFPLRNFVGGKEPPLPEEQIDNEVGHLVSAEEADTQAAPEAEAASTLPPFWVTLDNEGNVRRLHRLGGCFVDPERDCTSFRRLDVLKGVAVNSKCKLCFKEEQGGDLNQRGDKGPNADSSGSSSEESSSSEDGQEAEAANDAASCYAVEDW